MKINERDALNIPKPESERLYAPSKPESGSTRAARHSDSGNDQIDLGSQTGLLSQAVSAGSEERASRVEQLRALVQSGQYQVDTVALSRAIVTAGLSGY